MTEAEKINAAESERLKQIKANARQEEEKLFAEVMKFEKKN